MTSSAGEDYDAVVTAGHTITAAYAGGATHLHWSPNTEADLWYYPIYRGSSSDFTPHPSNRIGTADDAFLLARHAAG